jgi:alpha-tubulin suppressor-like RCC1 family protein
LVGCASHPPRAYLQFGRQVLHRPLEYFDRAAKINQALGVQNPLPYVEIARTYTQIGQFFAASINAEKALKLDPTSANTYGQLGNGTSNGSTVPVQVTNSSLTSATAIAAGYDHAIALNSDGSIWVWGNNANGQLGNATMSSSAVPVQVTGLANAQAIAAGYQYTLALYTSITTLTVYAWGINNSGQLGNGTTTTSSAPVAVSGTATVVAIAAGYDHAFALNAYGTVWTWVSNSNGQYCNGTTTSSLVPLLSSGVTRAVGIAAGTQNSFVLMVDGTLWACGRNDRGQIGDGTKTERLNPVRVQ